MPTSDDALGTGDARPPADEHLDALTGLPPIDEDDIDGDGLSNAAELVLGTNPFAADSDGDNTNDANDAFPLDPHLDSLPVNGGDTAAPSISLLTPANAIAL